MKISIFGKFLTALILLFCGVLAANAQAKTPVMIELFTSEGCPTCPPADKYLAQLENTQPFAGVELITLAWHVDYWNSFGWKDEFSSPVFSQRQVIYSRALNIGETYTPQMFVDGQAHFIGTKADKAEKAVAEAKKKNKHEIALSFDGSKLKVDLPKIEGHKRATVFLAFTESNLVRKIGRGNNAGKTLEHSSVVRSVRSIGMIEADKNSFFAETLIDIPMDWARENVKIVVFVQENQSRKILAVNRISLEYKH